jgi:8-hydroxy-5-deazaflavin:NADPH oxidoreductase
MFICGDDADTKAKIVTPLLKEFGWGVIDIGGIKESRYLEPLCMIWVLHGIHSKVLKSNLFHALIFS